MLFGNISGLAASSTGQALVSEWHRTSIRVLSSEGVPESEIGREGRGPGEFVSINNIYVGVRDSVYVFDFQKSAVSVFEPQKHQLAYETKIPRGDLYLPVS